jgi:hypothetical protein
MFSKDNNPVRLNAEQLEEINRATSNRQRYNTPPKTEKASSEPPIKPLYEIELELCEMDERRAAKKEEEAESAEERALHERVQQRHREEFLAEIISRRRKASH